MSGRREDLETNGADVAPGVIDAAEETVREKIGGYLLGLVLATLLTIVAGYLLATEGLKRLFYRFLARRHFAT